MNTARRQFRKNIYQRLDFVFENYVKLYLIISKGYEALFGSIQKDLEDFNLCPMKKIIGLRLPNSNFIR